MNAVVRRGDLGAEFFLVSTELLAKTAYGFHPVKPPQLFAVVPRSEPSKRQSRSVTRALALSYRIPTNPPAVASPFTVSTSLTETRQRSIVDVSLLT